MGFRLTPVVQYLLIMNVGVFVFMYLTGGHYFDLLALHSVNADTFYPFQFFTHMFMHSMDDPMHLIGNMFGLFMFGPMLESVWGSKRFIAFYLICGLGAALLYSGVQYYGYSQIEKQIVEYKADPDPNTYGVILDRNFRGLLGRELGMKAVNIYLEYKDNPTSQVLAKNSEDYLEKLYEFKVNTSTVVGASGAIFGILMAFALLFPNTEILLLFIPFPIKAKYLVAFYGLYELYAGFRRATGDNVAHFAHIGGMIFAFILIKYWQRKRNTFY